MVQIKLEHLLIVSLEKGEIWLANEFLTDHKLVKKCRPSQIPGWMVVLSRLVNGERVPFPIIHKLCGDKREQLIVKFLEKVNKEHGTSFSLVWLHVTDESLSHEFAVRTLGLADKIYQTLSQRRRD